jgi:hypothetical protein
MSFRAAKIGADLHTGRAKGKHGSDPTPIGDAAGGDDRNRHGVDDLRHERKGPDLWVDIRLDEHATVAASLGALGNDDNALPRRSPPSSTPVSRRL